MSNDQKPPAKTMMGWAPNAAPPGQPQPPAPQPWNQPPQQPPAPQPWNAQPPAPPAPQPWNQPPPPQQQQPWNQPPPPQQQQPWNAQPPQQQQGWGGPPQGQSPMQPAWGGPPPQAQPAFGAPPGVGFGAPPDARGRGIPGADATIGSSARLRFIRLTYLHLFGAILGFTALEYFFLGTAAGRKLVAPLVKFAIGYQVEDVFIVAPRWHWGVVLAAFSLVSIGTHYLAEHTRSKPAHYIGLVLYTLAEAIIFVPLLTIVVWVTADMIARGKGDPNILRDSAIITLSVFGALTASVFFTKKDFSFLRTALAIGGAAAMGLIALSIVFGFNLGIVFSIAMVLLAAGQILYETSQIMAHDDPENYVGAALSLFASVALLFWYVIRILLKLRSE